MPWTRIIVALLLAIGIFSLAKAQEDSIIGGGMLGVFKPAAGGGLLLDSLSATSVGAFSSRKLRSAYAGNALQVTTSAAGNATQNIGFSSNDLDTASLASFIGSNSGTIQTWYDQASTNNAAEATVSRQPQIVNAGTNNTVNGHVCPVWNGGSPGTLLQWAGSLTQAQPITLALLIKLASGTQPGGGAHFHDGISGSRPLFGTSSTIYQIFAGSSALTGGTLDTSVHTSFAIFNGTSSSVKIDATTIITGNPGTAAFDSMTKSIGAGNGGVAINGEICEFIAFSSALGGTDQSTIRSSWQTYWGAP